MNFQTEAQNKPFEFPQQSFNSLQENQTSTFQNPSTMTQETPSVQSTNVTNNQNLKRRRNDQSYLEELKKMKLVESRVYISKQSMVYEQPFTVERIVAKKIVKGQPLYRVKWFGYPKSENTWEPLEHLGDCEDYIQKFEHRQWQKKLQKLKLKESSLTKKQKSQLKKVSKMFSITKPETRQKEMSQAEKDQLRKQKQFKRFIDPTQNALTSELLAQRTFQKQKDFLQKFTQNVKSRTDPAYILNKKQGHYILGDTPDGISVVKKQGDRLVFTMVWKPRQKGKSRPEDTCFNNLELRYFDPYRLIDFYESQLRFIRPKKPKKKQRPNPQEPKSDSSIKEGMSKDSKQQGLQSIQKGEAMPIEKPSPLNLNPQVLKQMQNPVHPITNPIEVKTTLKNSMDIESMAKESMLQEHQKMTQEKESSNILQASFGGK